MISPDNKKHRTKDITDEFCHTYTFFFFVVCCFGGARVKLFFVDDIVFFLKDLKDYTRKFLDIINTFSKYSRIQNQHKKSAFFSKFQ
jgi:hypothetical protein